MSGSDGIIARLKRSGAKRQSQSVAASNERDLLQHDARHGEKRIQATGTRAGGTGA